MIYTPPPTKLRGVCFQLCLSLWSQGGGPPAQPQFPPPEHLISLYRNPPQDMGPQCTGMPPDIRPHCKDTLSGRVQLGPPPSPPPNQTRLHCTGSARCGTSLHRDPPLRQTGDLTVQGHLPRHGTSLYRPLPRPTAPCSPSWTGGPLDMFKQICSL